MDERACNFTWAWAEYHASDRRRREEEEEQEKIGSSPITYKSRPRKGKNWWRMAIWHLPEDSSSASSCTPHSSAHGVRAEHHHRVHPPPALPPLAVLLLGPPRDPTPGPGRAPPLARARLPRGASRPAHAPVPARARSVRRGRQVHRAGRVPGGGARVGAARPR